jgi:hypothetical protein
MIARRFFALDRHSERGIAMVLSLFLMLAMSVVAASLMFMSQTETYSSMNYRLMSQARYGAEAGVARAANFLMYSTTYTKPTTGGADNITAYTFSGVSPVTYAGKPVVLSANPNVASNYPVASVQTAFNAAVGGTLSMGGTNVQYQPYATLMSMRQINTYGGGLETIQMWQVVSDGVVSIGRTAKVEVTATIESVAMPITTYGAFATNAGCGALTFSGADNVDSYDSSKYTANGNPPTASNGGLSNSGGNVGTNGNLGESGNATIYGTLSTPRTGIGDCSAGNVDALSSSGHAKLCPDSTKACSGIQDPTADIVHLPQQNLPTPPTMNPLPPTSTVQIKSSTSCSDLGLTASNCTGSPGSLTLIGGTTSTPVTLGNVEVRGGTLTLAGGNYSWNSLTLNGNANVVIAPATGAVVLNIAGQAQDTPIDLTGGSFANASYDPAMFQILYGGTGTVKLNGGNGSAAVIYAPNASASLNGNNDFYGSITANTIVDNGNASIHYDRNLSNKFFGISNPMLGTFSWKRF